MEFLEHDSECTMPIVDRFADVDDVERFCAHSLAQGMEIDGIGHPCHCDKCIVAIWRPLIVQRNEMIRQIAPDEAMPLNDPEGRAELNRTLGEIKSRMGALVDMLERFIDDSIDGMERDDDEVIRAPGNPFEC